MLKSFLKLKTMTLAIRPCVSQFCSALPLRSSPGFGIVLMLGSPKSKFTPVVMADVESGVEVGLDVELGFGVGLGVGLGFGVGLGPGDRQGVGLGFGVGL